MDLPALGNPGVRLWIPVFLRVVYLPPLDIFRIRWNRKRSQSHEMCDFAIGLAITLTPDGAKGPVEDNGSSGRC